MALWTDRKEHMCKDFTGSYANGHSHLIEGFCLALTLYV